MPDQPMVADAEMVAFTESFLDRYGPDTPKGVGDLREDYVTGHRVMLEVIRDAHRPMSLLDFGCGLSTLNDVLISEGPGSIVYSGLDVSERFIAESRKKYPGVRYYTMDVLADGFGDLPDFDYVVMNGLFHYRGSHTDEEMTSYLHALVSKMFTKARIGLAFSVVSPQVDWVREDLFHVPVDPLLSFLSREVTRHVVIRHDYGMYEYSVYLYREPSDPERADAARLLRPTSKPHGRP